MANTSATGGALLPTSPAPPSDLDLDVILGRLVTGITGLAPGMVRPRWQPKPPQQPPADEDWCAIGVVRTAQDGGTRAAIVHEPSDEGSDRLIRHEILEVMVSFYGPASAEAASLLRDGLLIGQNREPLFHASMGLVDIGPIVPAPALVNTTWIRRQDITFRVRRRIERVYAVRNLLTAQGRVSAEGITDTFSTEN